MGGTKMMGTYAPATPWVGGASAPQRGLRVLLAEDDEQLRRLVAATLRRRGYSVLEARNGREALRHVGRMIFERSHTDHPDIIVADVQMPELSGVDVLRGVRGARLGTPVILATAFADMATRIEAEALGVSELLEKPFGSQDLLRAIERASATLHPPRRLVA